MPTVLLAPLSERVRARIRELDVPARIAAWLNTAGVEAWLVGGFLRDIALGREPHDLDIAITGDTTAIAEGIAAAFGGRAVPLDIERGVVRIVFASGATIDLTRIRGGSILADLGERDFTVDAIAAPFSEAAGPLLDPYDGIGDLSRRLH